MPGYFFSPSFTNSKMTKPVIVATASRLKIFRRFWNSSGALTQSRIYALTNNAAITTAITPIRTRNVLAMRQNLRRQEAEDKRKVITEGARTGCPVAFAVGSGTH
jgi:hypothetical protein